MGANNQPEQNSKSGSSGKNPKGNLYEIQYKQAFEKLQKQTDFFNEFLNECPSFGSNLSKLFPKPLNSFDQFYEMVTYLRKYEPVIKTNKQAFYNSKNTTLLDRFFMICLGNIGFGQYEHLKVAHTQIQKLLLNYYSLFISKAQESNLKKIAKYIHMQSDFEKEDSISVRKFSEKLRQHMPHVQKFLKDYYYRKFHDCVRYYRHLLHFKSKILREDAVILTLKLTQIAKSEVVQLYNSEDFGIGFHTIQKKLVGYTGPWLLLVEHSEKNIDGDREKYIFGTYQNGPIKDLSSYQGDLTAFMFSIQPNIRYMTTDKGQGGNFYFLINNLDQRITKRRKGIGFGGNKDKQNFKLWLDQDLDKSKVFNGNDPTYGYGALAGPGTDTLYIKRIQIWALGSKQNLQDQEEYWKERYEEIMKRRKVNKKEFVDQNAGLFFENTFAHRDQVYGQIEGVQQKPQKKKEGLE